MMNEFEVPLPAEPANDTPVADAAAGETLPVESVAEAEKVPAPEPVNPARSAAGRLGAQRVHLLAELGRAYEQEHGLTPGRQRLRQLIQLGKRYEVEHGLRAPKPRRKKRGDAWTEFLSALARVVKPAYRPAVEGLVRELTEKPDGPQPRAAA